MKFRGGARVVILILLYIIIISFNFLGSGCDTEVGILVDLFHSTPSTPRWEGTIVCSLTAFSARRIVQPIFPYNRF